MMASKQEPPVPHINTPPTSGSAMARGASPDSHDGYLPPAGPCTPARSVSPSMTSKLLTSPPLLLRRAPSVESQSISRSKPKTDVQTDYSIRSLRSKSRLTRTTSTSDNFSTLTPTIASHSSGGGSHHSSDTGHSPCSLGSSGYLSPPNFQSNSGNPPYRPRRQSSNSLTMARKVQGLETTLDDRASKSKNRRRRRHNCHHSQTNNMKWSFLGCQVAPTAPTGMKELCKDHVGRHRPKTSARGNTDTYGRVLPRLWSDPTPPVITRRWSSIEIGAHQIHLSTILPRRSVVSVSHSPRRCGPQSSNPKINQRFRSSTFTRGAIDHDIVRTVREKLTLRKLPSTDLDTPATITLRRASESSRISDVNATSETKSWHTLSVTPPLALARRQTGDQPPDAEYLITSKDIDSITELIEANLRRNFRAHSRVSAYPRLLTHHTTQRTRSRSITSQVLFPNTVIHAEKTAAAIAQVPITCSKPQEDGSFLQVIYTSHSKTNSMSRSPRPSAHEVIWEPGGSLQSTSSVTDEDDRKPSQRSESSSPQNTPTATPNHNEPSISQLSSPKTDRSSAFDPRHARASIHEWSRKLSQAEIPAIGASSDSDSNDLTPSCELPPKLESAPPISAGATSPEIYKLPRKAKSRPAMKSSLSSPDVVSFPPLPPRQSTSDWYSPLPDIERSPRFSTTRSLYDKGIDATGAKVVNAPSPQRPQGQPLTDCTISPRPSIEFDPDYEMHRRSVVKSHPKAPCRVGSSSSMGSSIGCSGRERRKSAGKPTIQRVQTIDNIHKGERAGTWTKARPPSICPPPKPPSPSEFDDDRDYWMPSIPPQRMRSGYVDRMSLIRDKSPPLLKVEHVGIYGTVTSSMRTAVRLDVSKDELAPHVCDDCTKDPRNPGVD